MGWENKVTADSKLNARNVINISLYIGPEYRLETSNNEDLFDERKLSSKMHTICRR